MPFLILQPLVENALRHGVARREGTGPGKVEVIAQPDGAWLHLEVWDNGPGPGKEPGADGGIGLGNVRARLAELYGDEGTLVVGPAPGGGTLARVTVPRRTPPPAAAFLSRRVPAVPLGPARRG